MMMELRELRSFVVLADLLHFGRAARVLNLSQPALSKQIMKLEEDVAASLFHRNTGGTILSPAGMVLVKDARALLASADAMLLHAQQAGRGEVGRLNVAFGIYTYQLVPRVIARFRSLYPQIFVSLRDLSTAAQIELLRNRQLDVGFMRVPAPSEFHCRQVGHDRFVFALPNAIAAEWTKGTPTALAHQPFVLLSRKRSAALFDQVIRVCSAYRFVPKITQEADEITTVLALVASGAGVGVVPRTAMQKIDGVVYREIKHASAQWRAGAVWRRDEPDPVITHFMACLDAELEAEAG